MLCVQVELVSTRFSSREGGAERALTRYPDQPLGGSEPLVLCPQSATPGLPRIQSPAGEMRNSSTGSQVRSASASRPMLSGEVVRITMPYSKNLPSPVRR